MVQSWGDFELVGKPRINLDNKFERAVEVFENVANFGRIFLKGTTYFGSIYQRIKRKKADIVAYQEGGYLIQKKKRTSNFSRFSVYRS